MYTLLSLCLLSVCDFDLCYFFFFFKQKTAYEMRISDWSSDCALPISSPPLVSARRWRLSCSLRARSTGRIWIRSASRRSATAIPVRKCISAWWRPTSSATKIGRAHVELQSLMRISYAVFCLQKKNNTEHTNTTKTQDRQKNRLHERE